MSYQIDKVDVKSEDMFLLMSSLVTDLGALRTAVLALIADVASLRTSALALETHAGNRIYSAPVLAPGGTATKFKTTGILQYAIAGKMYTKAATDNIATPTSTGAGEFRKDLVVIDAAGTFAVVEGEVAASQGAAVCPAVPASKVAVGVLEIPESFTGGTTEVTAGMCTAYTHDVAIGAVSAAMGSLGTTIGS